MLVRRPVRKGRGGRCHEPGRTGDHIARFKRPKDYRFVDALPTNHYGKAVRRELRDRLRAETAVPGHEHHSEETVS
jgi:acyl-CoA synthetase (AMP-forming)/AMP-acid ligase II